MVRLQNVRLNANGEVVFQKNLKNKGGTANLEKDSDPMIWLVNHVTTRLSYRIADVLLKRNPLLKQRFSV
jgi:hypothetical protein